MADAAAPSLGDFFKSKGKKKIKASNLNKESTTKTDDPKKKVKSSEDDVWEEEQVVAATMKVEVAGKLMREEEKVEEDKSAQAWGNLSKEKKDGRNDLNEKRYPKLATSAHSINIDDGSDAKVNIATSKNHFAALEGDEGSDEENQGSKRPKAIKPAMISKKKGESEKMALQREVDKYSKKDIKKKEKKASGEEDNDDEEDEDEEEEEQAAPVEDEDRKKKAPEKKEKKEVSKPAEEEEEELAEDLKMQPDLEASKEKYKGRKKQPEVSLPREELEEEKENKPKQQPAGKKKKFMAVEETEKKIAYADW